MLGRKLVEDLPVPFETYAAVPRGDRPHRDLPRPPPAPHPPLRAPGRRLLRPGREAVLRRPRAVARTPRGPAGELMEQLLLAHELTHALQDQRLGLDRRMKALRDSTDALLALQAVLEGEATLLMTEALVESVPGDAREALGSDPIQQILDGLDSPAAVEGAEGVPDFFVKELVFPYAAGTAWVRQKTEGRGLGRRRRRLPEPPVDDERDPPARDRSRRRESASPPPTGPTPGRVPGRRLDDLVRHARRVGPRDPPRAGGRRRRSEGRGGRVAGRPGRLLRAEGGTARRRRRLPLEDSRREPRRGEDGSRTLLAPLYAGRPAAERPSVTTRGDVVEVALAAVRAPAA